MYTIQSDLRPVPNYSGDELDRFLANSPLHGAGRDFVEAGKLYGVNPVYIMALGILESNWGRSNYAQTRNNLFGYQAYDSNPDMAATFSSFAKCIHFIAQFLSRSYLSAPDGKYYQLRNGQWGKVGQWWGGAPTLEGVYKIGQFEGKPGKYATAPHAAQAVCNIMNQFIEFAGKPVGAVLASNPAPKQPVPSQGEYTVVRGDSLWEIAERYLGAGARYHEIVALNGLANPNLIRVGQKLKIPSKSSTPQAQKPAPSVRTHTVQPGENLWVIAERYYKNGGRYGKIAEANRNLIKQDNLIQPGWNLVIPE